MLRKLESINFWQFFFFFTLQSVLLAYFFQMIISGLWNIFLECCVQVDDRWYGEKADKRKRETEDTRYWHSIKSDTIYPRRRTNLWCCHNEGWPDLECNGIPEGKKQTSTGQRLREIELSSFCLSIHSTYTPTRADSLSQGGQLHCGVLSDLVATILNVSVFPSSLFEFSYMLLRDSSMVRHV